jgi:renalase
MSSIPHVETFIIGAGLTGISLASKLQSLGVSYTIAEKSKGVGGRLASRRINENIFDHGAQHIEFFSTSTSDFKKFITAPDDTLIWDKKNDHSYYSYSQGMTSLLKHHSRNLKIQFNTKITQISKHNLKWLLTDEQSNTYSAQNVVLTSPLPQALDLLNNCNIAYPVDLNQISYAKKIIYMLCLKNYKNIESPCNFELNSADIKKIYSQNSKRSNSDLTFTLVMSDDFSNRHFDSNDEELTEKLSQILSQNTLLMKNLTDLQIKKWRYAYPLNGVSAAFLEISQNLYLAGDAFAGTDRFANNKNFKVLPPKFNPGNNAYNSAIGLTTTLTARSLCSLTLRQTS